MSEFKKLTEDEVEETTESIRVHKISETEAKIASAEGSIDSYKTQIKDLKELLKNLKDAE